MKKVIFFIAGIIATSAILYSCGLLRSLREVEDNGFICTNYSGTRVNTMDKDAVLSMIRNYYNNQYRAINARDGASGDKLVHFPSDPRVTVDSRAVFFNIDTLKRLLYYIDKATSKFSAADKANLGVNIYFASYPEEMNMHIRGDNYTNRHTLIFLPSIFDSRSGLAKDFDLNYNLSGTNLLKPKYLDLQYFSSISTIPGMGVMRVAGASGDDMGAQNHGTGVPPPPSPTGNTILDLTDPF